MPSNTWTWKGKDGAHGRLLYESGNWGDLLKMAWTFTFLDWASERFEARRAAYFDPFAGAPVYPLGAKTKFRFDQARLATLERIREPYLERGVWPSTAMAAMLANVASATVFDADAGRLVQWRAEKNARVADVASGWDMLESARPDQQALWLIDPYDFIAEWRVRLPGLLAKAGTVSLMVYIYNRAAKNAEAFAEYRAFRNALDDGLPRSAKRIGRVASDAFLPRAHHEMLFLPSETVAKDSFFSALLARLEEEATAVDAAERRAGAFDC